MSKNFWQDEGEFRDSPVEMENGQWKEVETEVPPQTAGQRIVKVPGHYPAPAEDQVTKEYVEEQVDLQFPDDDEEDDYTAILSDARLRLEQGKLYEMIMNHDLFQGLDADARAIKNVQREIRRFARERMEVMLGMRQEQPKAGVEVELPFNQLEITILKKLASAATKGATEKAETKVSAPVVPKKEGLTPISAPKSSAPKPLAPKPATPVKRQAPVAKAPAPQIPAVDEDYKPLEKPPSEMTADELIQRNRESQARLQKQAKSKTALPMPTYEEQELLHTQRALSAAPAVSAIVAAINQSKK